MTTTITVDRAGRVLIPKSLRQKLRLSPGDELQLNSEGEKITLQPVRARALIKKERGVWVYQGEAMNASIPDVIDRERERRLLYLMTDQTSEPQSVRVVSILEALKASLAIAKKTSAGPRMTDQTWEPQSAEVARILEALKASLATAKKTSAGPRRRQRAPLGRRT